MKRMQSLITRLISGSVCLTFLAGVICQIGAFEPLAAKERAVGTEFTYTQDFETQSAVTDDFLSYYADDVRTGYTMSAIDFETYWKIENGQLVRKDQAGEYFDRDRLVAMLTYDKKTFTDFELTLAYTFGAAPGRVMIGLGSTELGKYPSGEAGSALVAIDSSRKAAVFGAASSGAGTYSDAAPILNDNAKYGELSVKVSGNELTVTLNGAVLKTVTLSDYKGGYISVMASKVPNAVMDNLKITGLASDPSDPGDEDEDLKKADYYNTFDSKKEIMADFLTFYSDDVTTNSQLNNSAFDTHWTVADGQLKRKDQAGETFDAKHYVAALTYAKKIFTDFELNVDYQYGNTPGRMMIGFGGSGLGTYAASDVGGVVIDIASSGNITLSGALRSGSVTAAGSKTGRLTVKVENRHLTVSLGGSVVQEAELTADYNGGYISLLCSKVTNGTFDNLTINGLGKDDPTVSYSNDFSAADALGDFTYYYSDNLNATGNLATNGILNKQTAAKWELVDGAARRMNQWSDDYNNTYDNNHLIGTLTYEAQTFQNFRLDLDFTWNVYAYCHGNLMVLFGQRELGHYVTLEDGGTAAVVDESNRTQLIGSFYGNHKEGNGLVAGVGGTRPSVALTDGAIYHMTVYVYKDVAYLYVNGVLLSQVTLPTYYNGYISIAANKNIFATVDNLQIRALESTLPNDGSRYENDFSDAGRLSDFTAYYSDNISATENLLAEEDFDTHWKLENGRVIRKDQTGENFDEIHYMSLLTYTGQTYNSFLFECDFVYGSAPGRLIFVIGQENLGTYANINGGGLAMVLDVSGNATIKGYVNGIRYAAGASTNMMRNSMTNHLKITYYDGSLTIELNDSEVYYGEVPGLDGYISFGATKVPNAAFDNLVITDYNKVQVDPTMQSKVTAIEQVDDLTWDRTEDNTNTLGLPEKLKITTDKDEEIDCRVKWTSEDYLPSRPGVFHFVGTPVMPAGGLLVNPDHIAATSTVTVTVDYDTSTTVKYYIDALDDFNDGNWQSRYASDPRSEDLLETPVESLYHMEEGRLRRLDGDGEVGDHTEMTSLVYTGRTFRNFQLDVDFRQGGNTWGQVMFGFGIEDPLSYVTLSGGGALAYMTMEGNARFRGRMVMDTNSYGEVRSPSNSTEYNDTWNAEMHHLTLRVTKLHAVMEIDGVEVLECTLRDSYTGGYISLMSNKNTAIYDNFSITALDYDGNVITLAEHDLLPDTFSTEEKLIGEEEDDGSGIEIIGLAYKLGPNNKYLEETTGSSSSFPPTGDRFPLYVFVSVALLAGVGSLAGLKRIRLLNTEEHPTE